MFFANKKSASKHFETDDDPRYHSNCTETDASLRVQTNPLHSRGSTRGTITQRRAPFLSRLGRDRSKTPRYLHSTTAGSLARVFGRIRLRQRLSLKLFVLLHSGGGLSSVQIRGICIPSGIKNRGNSRSCRRRASIRLYYMVGQCARRKLYQRWILCDVRTKKSVDARGKLLYTVDKENADSSGFPHLSMQTDLLRKIPIDSAHPRNHRGGNYAGLRKKLCI